MIQWVKNIDIVNKIKKKAFWGKLLALFFIVMILCTILSRAADSVIVPKVRLAKPSSGSLNYKIKGTGSIKASEGQLVTMPEQLRIKEVISPGTNVEPGDKLTVVDTDELVKILDEQNAKLEQLRLQLKKEHLNAVPDATTPQTLAAGKNLDLAQYHYNDAVAELNAAIAEEESESFERQRKAEEEKQAAYDAFMLQGGEENVDAKLAYEQTILNIDQQLEQAATGKQAQIDALTQSREAMQDALEQAQAAYEIAQVEEGNAKANRQKASQGSGITQQGLEIDIAQQQKVIDRLMEVANAGGIVKSPAKGTVTENTLKEGLITSGQEYIRIGTGGYEFEAPVDKDNALKLKVGDVLEVTFSGKRDKKKLKITGIQSENDKNGNSGGSQTPGGNESEVPQGQTDMMYITAQAEGDDFAAGMEGEFLINKESDIRYDWILPIEAVREDQKGTYCLVSDKKNTILGEEYVAKRVDLVKKAKDVNHIAVDGALINKSEIIIESSKEINEGDRVRIEENN